MSTLLSAAPATQPGLRCLVVLNPRSGLAASLFIFGLLLLPLAALKAATGSYQRATIASLLGVSLLGLTARKVVRRNQPLVLTSDQNGLHLKPLGQDHTPGQPPETIPLASIKAYQYWLRLLRWRVVAQCHLRLELADGRVLHLADRLGTRPDDPAGTVQLDAVARRFARRKTGPPRRPLFFLTPTARRLLWASWAAVVVGSGLLGLGFSVGLLLLVLVLGAGYSATYYLGRGADDITV